MTDDDAPDDDAPGGDDLDGDDLDGDALGGDAPRGHFLQRMAGGGSVGSAIGAGMAEFNAFLGQGRAWPDEKASRALRREQDEAGEPPRLEIDLDAGTARYRRPRPRSGEGPTAG